MDGKQVTVCKETANQINFWVSELERIGVAPGQDFTEYMEEIAIMDSKIHKKIGFGFGQFGGETTISFPQRVDAPVQRIIFK